MGDVQQGHCAICGRSAALVIDHCHKTGLVRNLICDSCNRGLGCFKDSPEVLLRAVEYLTGVLPNLPAVLGTA